nr:hypothetical protein [Corallococcus exiguus]
MKLGPPRFVIRKNPAQLRPKRLAMIVVEKVRNLMRHDVIKKLHWSLHDTPVESDHAGRAASPPLFLLTHKDLR